jgi:hypothetical protein
MAIRYPLSKGTAVKRDVSDRFEGFVHITGYSEVG